MKAPPAIRRESEAEFQAAVMDLAQRLGWAVFHVHDSRRQVGGRLVGDADAAGLPDLILARERVIYAELKTTTGRLSEAQKRWIGVLRAAGQEVYVWRPEDFDDILELLTRSAV